MLSIKPAPTEKQSGEGSSTELTVTPTVTLPTVTGPSRCQDDRGSDPRCGRNCDQRLVCQITRVNRRRPMALPGLAWPLTLWQTGQRATAAVAWAVWLVTSARNRRTRFRVHKHQRRDAVTGVTRHADRTVAQTALADAVTARDRECKGGVGKFCHERESAVAERRGVLDGAMASMGQVADPQTEAAVKLGALGVWRGALRAAPEDFAMADWFC